MEQLTKLDDNTYYTKRKGNNGRVISFTIRIENEPSEQALRNFNKVLMELQ